MSFEIWRYPYCLNVIFEKKKRKHFAFSVKRNHIVGRESKTCIFDFHIFQERQKTEYLLLGVSFIAESQTGLYLVTTKFTVIGVLNFQ